MVVLGFLLLCLGLGFPASVSSITDSLVCCYSRSGLNLIVVPAYFKGVFCSCSTAIVWIPSGIVVAFVLVSVGVLCFSLVRVCFHFPVGLRLRVARCSSVAAVLGVPLFCLFGCGLTISECLASLPYVYLLPLYAVGLWVICFLSFDVCCWVVV